MNDRRFSLGSLVNLITLCIGLAVGFLLGNLEHKSVRAQAVLPPTPRVEDVAPMMTMGSIGANLVLAHEVDADKIVVNGMDLLQFDQNVLNYLSRRPGAENAELENLINASRATVLHRIAQPKAALPEQTKPVSPEKK